MLTTLATLTRPTADAADALTPLTPLTPLKLLTLLALRAYFQCLAMITLYHVFFCVLAQDVMRLSLVVVTRVAMRLFL